MMKPLEITTESIESQFLRYVDRIREITRKQIPVLKFDPKDQKIIENLLVRDDIVTLLEGLGRESFFINKQGISILTLRYKDFQQVRQNEKDERAKQREKFLNEYQKWLNWCWDKTAWCSEPLGFEGD